MQTTQDSDSQIGWMYIDEYTYLPPCGQCSSVLLKIHFSFSFQT